MEEAKLNLSNALAEDTSNKSTLEEVQ